MSKFKGQRVPNNFVKNTKNTSLYFRSKWESDFAAHLDNHPRVKLWEFDFPFKYYDAYVSKKNTTYYIDFKVEMVDGDVVFFEVKPTSSLQERVKTKSARYKKIHNHNYLKNLSKFDSVVNFCTRAKCKFYIVEKKASKFHYYKWNAKTHTITRIK